MPRPTKVNDVNAEHDAILGDQINNISVVLNMGAYAPPPNLAQLRADYLTYLRRNHRALDFKGIPQLDTLSHELLLEEVYVPLVARSEIPAGETWERRLAGRSFAKSALPDASGPSTGAEALAALGKAEAAPVHVEQAMAEKSLVVVIGDPGSGKTTLLKYLALRLAAEENAPLPILVPLNAYADALTRADPNLQHYLAEYFRGLAACRRERLVGPLR